MTRSISKNKIIRLAIFLVPLLIVCSQCINLKKTEDPRGKTYAGSATCVSCHKDISSSYLHTAHFMASMLADSSNIQGSFKSGLNEFVFSPAMKVTMSKNDSGFYQTSYINGKADQSRRFDISFGGVKGQTYAYWLANELFQLPISTSKSKWINSPGYDPNRVVFERMVGTLCLDCHASYVKQAKPDLPGFYSNAEGFEKSSLIYSVDCERCHGPAAEHVKFHMDNPSEKQAKYITSFKSLTRDQKINMCAVCHSGASARMLKPTFDFKPGDNINKYMSVSPSAANPDYRHIDVHGNQKALLESSKCFINSNMDCSSCHNTHANDRDNPVLYANRCMTCHSNVNSHNLQCKLTNQLSKDMLKSNCISCHMPAFPSKLIIAGETGALVHTHHIAIYSSEAQKVLAYLKPKKT